MAHFVLIHGAWHGGWCWTKLAPLLEAAGHQVSTPDLPGHGSRRRWPRLVSMEHYISSVSGVLSGCREPVVLVGHSMGGMVVTGAAERHPDRVSSVVYLCAYAPPSGRSLLELAEPSVSLVEPEAQLLSWWGGSMRIKRDRLAGIFYNDCSAEDIAYARARLCPQSVRALGGPVKWTASGFGRVRKRAIICAGDHAISAAGQESMAVGVGVASGDIARLASDHSPFFSMPQELADILLGWA